jgi:hypothetical protein
MRLVPHAGYRERIPGNRQAELGAEVVAVIKPPLRVIPGRHALIVSRAANTVAMYPTVPTWRVLSRAASGRYRRRQGDSRDDGQNGAHDGATGRHRTPPAISLAAAAPVQYGRHTSPESAPQSSHDDISNC